MSLREQYQKAMALLCQQRSVYQSYGFSSSHIWMWELDNKESWVPNNWCFQTVILEKTLESPLDSEEIKPVNPKGNQPWIFIERTDAKVEAPILWPPDVKSWLIWKAPGAGNDWGQEEKGTTRGWDGWMASLIQWSEQTQGDSEGWGSLVCCSSWGHKSRTWLSNYTTNNNQD